jgi:predicted nucleotidyltransferase
MTRTEIVDRLESALSGRTDVRLAVLFGSWARGTERPGSDVDVAVDALGVDDTALSVELGDVLGCDVDVVSLRTESIPLLHSIVRDGIVVHEGRPGAGALWRSHALATLEIDLPWFRRMAEAMLTRLATPARERGPEAPLDG